MSRRESGWPLPLALWLTVLTACGGLVASPAASPSPPIRLTEISMSGALNGSYNVINEQGVTQCGGALADDPHAINYILAGHVEGATIDVGISLQFGVHRYSKPGKFSIGKYPSGSSSSPAIVSVVREITSKHIVSWISGSGTLVVDPGTHSGTLDVLLSSSSGLGELTVVGSWVCPNH